MNTRDEFSLPPLRRAAAGAMKLVTLRRTAHAVTAVIAQGAARTAATLEVHRFLFATPAQEKALALRLRLGGHGWAIQIYPASSC